MTALDDAVATAESNVQAARDVLRDWQQRAQAAEDQAQQHRGRLGEVMLTDPERARQLQQEADRLESDADAARAAVQAAQEQLLRALPAVREAQAEVLRAQAGELWEQVRERLATTYRLQQELSAHEGIEWTRPTQETGAYGAVVPTPTITDGLAAQAQALDSQANALLVGAGREPVFVRHGRTHADGTQEILVLAGMRAEPDQRRSLQLLIDGRPARRPDDGRLVELHLGQMSPTLVQTITVPAGSVVQVHGAQESASCVVAETAGA